ncbi:MAG: SDR family oxidoreductase [Phycisphaeraceae bacterium]|nr:SDR family oxidoreductase [Phycisphaerae bacterium]MBX3392805.1 SDR family oxidoreductase [Phycisphaeraceae bacterium]
MATANPIALVTGAGSGIGLACAARLAREGFDLLLIGRRVAALREAAAAIGGETRREVHAADVGEPGQARGCVEAALAAFGGLDVIVNNAGSVSSTPIGSACDEEIERLFRVNIMGPAAIIDRAWPVLVGRGSGRIVNVSSYATMDPFPGLGYYAAAKAGLNVLTRACHNEGYPAGIRSFAVAPGAVETDMLRSLFPREVLPTERTLDPGTVADVVIECVRGERDAESGGTIFLPSP